MGVEEHDWEGERKQEKLSNSLNYSHFQVQPLKKKIMLGIHLQPLFLP